MPPKRRGAAAGTPVAQAPPAKRSRATKSAPTVPVDPPAGVTTRRVTRRGRPRTKAAAPTDTPTENDHLAADASPEALLLRSTPADGNSSIAVDETGAGGGSEHAQRWINSTSLPVRSAQVSNIDPAVRMAEAMAEVFERTLSTMRDGSFGGNNSRVFNRLTPDTKLPVFSGEPLDWLHFKEAFDLSSESGGYSDRENIGRLFTALQGKAREEVHSLLATRCDSESVIKTLELHFGNKQAIAQKIVDDLKKLPEVTSGKTTIISFATKLRNAVVAFKRLEIIGYLHSPELANLLWNKLPSGLQYEHRRFAARAPAEKSDLEKLSDFLYAEAELAAASGLFTIEPSVSQSAEAEKKRPRTSATGAAYTVSHAPDQTNGQPNSSNNTSGACGYCRKDNHRLADCTRFPRESPEKRWALVKSYGVCFCCLEPGHRRNDCNAAKCSYCRRRHHAVLHPTSQSASHPAGSARPENSSKKATESHNVNTQS